MNQKIKLGQFFTVKDLWLKKQIIDFIISSKCTISYDPFAGAGDLLNATKSFFKNSKGLDIDPNLKWEVNDSLIKIPHIDDAIIITNPPYIAKQSASRKKIDLKKYFLSTKYDDIYLLALDRMIEAQDFVIAIIPESFINSNYKNKNKLNSITILEENPFQDTENPVCVVCFDGKEKSLNKIKIFKNENYVMSLLELKNKQIIPNNAVNICFNKKNGWLGLRAIDSTNPTKRIYFDFKSNFKYDWEKNIKVSSRHFSLIDIDVPIKKRALFITNLNKELEKLRSNTFDIVLTPFKGNTKNGVRRRRLDFRTARAIIEKVYTKMFK